MPEGGWRVVFCFWCYEHLGFQAPGEWKELLGVGRSSPGGGGGSGEGGSAAHPDPLPTFHPVPGVVLKEYSRLPQQRLLKQEKGMTFI